MATAVSKRELAVWRDRGYDDYMNDRAANAPMEMKSKERTAYFEGRRGAAKAKANGDGNVSSQRHRRPLIG